MAAGKEIPSIAFSSTITIFATAQLANFTTEKRGNSLISKCKLLGDLLAQQLLKSRRGAKLLNFFTSSAGKNRARVAFGLENQRNCSVLLKFFRLIKTEFQNGYSELNFQVNNTDVVASKSPRSLLYLFFYCEPQFLEPICCASSIVIDQLIFLTGGKILNTDGELAKSDKVLRYKHGAPEWGWVHVGTMKVPRAFHGSFMFQNLLKTTRKEVGENTGGNYF